MNQFNSPYPYFGGKSKIAPQVWTRLGPDVPQYVEPFFGSGAMLLARPDWREGVHWVETANDKDGMIANFWRAIQVAPDEVAHHADWPVNENDLHARHIWLVNQKFSSDFISRIEGDPSYYDAKIAGWWVWGMACWIGSGWCSGDGPHQSIDGKRVHLGNVGLGVNRKRVHLGNAGQGDPGLGMAGLYAWMEALSNRLRRVRVCSGDWGRVVTHGAMMNLSGPTAIFLDPPYSAEADRKNTLYAEEDLSIAHAVREWCIENGDNSLLRIALCGYGGEGHEELEALGWERLNWKAQGGMGNIGNGRGKANARREAIWFSPHCIKLVIPIQLRFED